MHSLEQRYPKQYKAQPIPCKASSNLYLEYKHGTQLSGRHTWCTERAEAQTNEGSHHQRSLTGEVETVIKAQRHPLSLHQTGGYTWLVQEDCINVIREIKSAKIITAMWEGRLYFHYTVSNLCFTSSYQLLSLQALAALAEELWYSPHLFPHTSGTSKRRTENCKDCKVATAAGNTSQACQ